MAPKVEVKTENTEVTKSSNVVPTVETNTVVEKDEPVVTVETNTTEDADSTTTTTVTTEVRPGEILLFILFLALFNIILYLF